MKTRLKNQIKENWHAVKNPNIPIENQFENCIGYWVIKINLPDPYIREIEKIENSKLLFDKFLQPVILLP